MKTTTTICFLLLAFFTYGQTKFQYKTVQPSLNIRKNESRTVSIIHSKTKTEQGKASSGNSFQYGALINVIDSTEDEFTIKWVYQFNESDSSDKAAMGMMKAVAGLPLIYTIDGSGGFRELVNWEEARDFVVRMLELNIPKKAGDSTNENLEKAKAMFSTKAMVQSAFLKEIQLLHAIYGMSYSTRLEKAPMSISVPITDDPVPAMASSQMTELTPTYYVIKTSQAIDRVAASKMFEQMFKKMGITDPKALAEAKKELATFEMSDQGSYKVNRETGWPIKAVYTRKGGATGISQIETYELSVK
jgi:hypothetical protein